MLLDIIWKIAPYGDIVIDSVHSFRVCIDTKCKHIRIAVLNQIASDLNGEIRHDMPHFSSIGYIKKDEFRIRIKSAKQQSNLSPGVPNEDFLIAQINKYIESCSPLNVIFLGENCSYFVQNAIKCDAIKNKKTKNKKKKADMTLIGSNGLVSFSIKQHDAQRWESADTEKGRTARCKIDQAIQEGKTSLECILDQNGNNIYRNGDKNNPIMKLSNEIYWNVDSEEKNKVVFGDDIAERGAVLMNTFKEKDFQYEDSTKTLKIHCRKIYTVNSEIEENDNPVWYVRNDITRNSKKIGIMGLRIESVFKSRIKYGVEV